MARKKQATVVKRDRFTEREVKLLGAIVAVREILQKFEETVDARKFDNCVAVYEEAVRIIKGKQQRSAK